MLSHLKVENFAVVEKVEIDFSPQLNVFTGETGAGKSILIDAISLFLNRKTNERAIRTGKDRLRVEALFSDGEREWVLRREVGHKKSLCHVDGEMVPFTVLQDKAVKLLNIYGQNEHVFLLNAANHRLFLDRFAENTTLLERLSGVVGRLRAALKERDDLKSQQDQLQDRLDLIAFQIGEIDKLNMEPGDDEALAQRAKILSSSEDILLRAERVVEDLYQGEASLYALLADRIRDIEYLRDIYPDLASLHQDLEGFYRLLPELSSTLMSKAEAVEYDEKELNAIQERLHALARLKAKYGCELDALLEKRDRLAEERDRLGHMEISIREVEKRIEALLAEYRGLNGEIRDRRLASARRLSEVVETELEKLEMKRARFVVDQQVVEPGLDNLSDRGTDRIEFHFSSNPGQTPGPLKEVISGGELSRLMLVLKSIVEDQKSSTYIFDEIDSGIGGKTAQFVGEKLKKISRSNQVICISHLPQIVSFADRHFLIDKEVRDDQTFSSTRELGEEGTVEEIARLMAGRDVNHNVLEAARNLREAARKRF